jgi:hypothetical protein
MTKRTKQEPIDVVDLLTQLLAQQVGALVSKTADELARLSDVNELTWEVDLYRGLADNCTEKAKRAMEGASRLSRIRKEEKNRARRMLKQREK